MARPSSAVLALVACGLIACAGVTSAVGKGILYGTYTVELQSPSMWAAENAWLRANHTQISYLAQSVRVVEVGWAPTTTIQAHPADTGPCHSGPSPFFLAASHRSSPQDSAKPPSIRKKYYVAFLQEGSEISKSGDSGPERKTCRLT